MSIAVLALSQLTEASGNFPVAVVRDIGELSETACSEWEPLRGSHRRTVRSSPAEASSNCPSAVVPNASELTPPL